MPARSQAQAQCLASCCESLCSLVVGSVLRLPYDSGAGRQVMVYLVTKQLKYPLQRSS